LTRHFDCCGKLPLRDILLNSWFENGEFTKEPFTSSLKSCANQSSDNHSSDGAGGNSRPTPGYCSKKYSIIISMNKQNAANQATYDVRLNRNFKKESSKLDGGESSACLCVIQATIINTSRMPNFSFICLTFLVVAGDIHSSEHQIIPPRFDGISGVGPNILP
jgi:hypothetical protein